MDYFLQNKWNEAIDVLKLNIDSSNGHAKAILYVNIACCQYGITQFYDVYKVY